MHDQQAYSILSIKQLNDEQRTFSGTATTPTPDSTLDIVEPLGASFTNPSPLLLFHDVERPVGQVYFHPPTAKGVDYSASIPKIDEPGTLKDRVDEAWQSVKARLITGVSVRLRAKPDDVKFMKNGGIHWLKYQIKELSLVTLGSNPDATIATVKSLDTGLAAPGTQAVIDAKHSAGASAPPRVVTTRSQDRRMKKSTADQIKDFENQRAAKAARLAEIMDVSAEKGESLDQAEETEYDDLKADIKAVDAHLVRLRDHEETMKATAQPINGKTTEEGSDHRGSHVFRVKETLPPGIEFARYAMCLASAEGNKMQALEIAKHRYPDQTRIIEHLKTAVAAGTTLDATWAGPLVQYQNFAGDFIEFLRPASIVGKFGTNGIPSLRRVPFNVRIPTQTSGGSASWVGQGAAKPLTKFDFDTITMLWSKLAAISVLTNELVRFSTPSAEMLVRDSLAAAITAKMDTDFVDPSKAAVANVSPASITNGITPVVASGATAAAFRTDFATLMGGFNAADLTPDTGVFIMSSSRALAISLMLNALGQPEFPTLTMRGGTLLGFPVIVSNYVDVGSSPSTDLIIFLNAGDIFLADDGQVQIDVSREASLQMDDAPSMTALTPTATSVVSMFQTNSIAIRAERIINWQRRRSTAVAYISNAAYTG